MKQLWISVGLVTIVVGCGSAPVDNTGASQQGLGSGNGADQLPAPQPGVVGMPVPPGTTPVPPGTTPVPPTGSCRKAQLGDPTSCKDSGTWKRYASDDCARDGSVLTDIQTSDACGPDQYRNVTFVCCTNPPPPPPPPPPTGCIDGSIHHPACADSLTLLREVDAMCKAIGLGISTFSVASECSPASYDGATFQCCVGTDVPVPQPAPPPPSEPKN